MKNLKGDREKREGEEWERGRRIEGGLGRRNKAEGGEGRDMVNREENAPSPPGYACSSRTGQRNNVCFMLLFLKI